ncbi:MAG TPA: hypothetical protein P5021_09590, partial [Candidatus Diapherotrites archaeon]|nr:hypothetical protein [Candidatus Diapherotrites archaeon]
MKRVISLLLCFALIVSAFAIANVTLVSAASVPAGFPAEIPFADDAFSITGERNDAARSFSLSYKTDKKLADVAALYRNFIKLYDSSYQETKGDIYSIFICKFPNYDLNLTVMEILSNTNVNITL